MLALVGASLHKAHFVRCLVAPLLRRARLVRSLVPLGTTRGVKFGLTFGLTI